MGGKTVSFLNPAFRNILNKLTNFPPKLVYISSIIFSLSGFILWGIYKINLPSFYYDELMFADVALGRIGNLPIFNHFFGIPTMIFPYIGALKSYVYLIIFHFFDPSYYSIRIPTLLLMSLAIFILARVIAALFGKTAALIILILLCFNPSLLMYGKFDVGPTVFEFFARCMIIFSLTLIALKKNPRRSLGLLVVFSILGMFNKLSFIWFLNSILPLFIALQLFLLKPTERKPFFTENFKTYSILLGTWVLAIIWFVGVYKINQLDPAANNDLTMYWQNLKNKFIGISTLIQNVGIYNNFLQQPVPFPSKPFLYFNLITFFSGCIYYFVYLFQYRLSKRLIDASHFIAILLLGSTGLLLAQIIFTPAAVHPWQFCCLFPSLLLFLIFSWIHLLQCIARHTLLHKTLLCLLISGMALYGILINSIVHKKITRTPPHTRNWERIFSTTTNDAFLAYLNNHPQVHFTFLDWGMHTLATTLLPAPRFRESLTPLFNTHINTAELFVTHGPAASAFPKLRPGFFVLLDQLGLAPTLVHQIVDTDGLTIFEFWKISKNNSIGTPIFNLQPDNLNLFQGRTCTLHHDRENTSLQINANMIDPVVILPKFDFPQGKHDFVVQVEMTSPAKTFFRLFPQTVTQPHYGFNLTAKIIPGNNNLFFLLPNHELIGRLRIDPGEKPGRYIFKSISVSLIKPEK